MALSPGALTVRCGTPRMYALVGLLCVVPVAAHAQRKVTFELRVGAALSTALATDSVVRQSVLNRLAGNGHTAEHAQATPGIAPTIQLAVRTPLREDVQLEAMGGWSFGKLRAGSGAESRSYQSLNITSATIGLRYAVMPRVHARASFGATRYDADPEGLFLLGGAFEPMVEGGVGSDVQLAFGALGIEAFGQVHRFGTASMRQVGGSGGTVIRGGVLIGFAPGGKR